LQERARDSPAFTAFQSATTYPPAEEGQSSVASGTMAFFFKTRYLP